MSRLWEGGNVSSEINLSAFGCDAVATAFGANVNGTVHCRISGAMGGFVDHLIIRLSWLDQGFGSHAVQLSCEHLQKCCHCPVD